MKRGDIIGVVGKGDFATKPRPGLIVQADAFNMHHPALTICPITSSLSGDSFYRVPIARDDANGLKRDSEVEIDRVQAIWRYRCGGLIGHASQATMQAVDRALRRWLQL